MDALEEYKEQMSSFASWTGVNRTKTETNQQRMEVYQEEI
jgi:hypothetical protein